MLAKIRAIIATLSIALYLPIIIVQMYLTRSGIMASGQEDNVVGFLV